MAAKATRFAYLMDRMGIKSSVLSEQTGIDKTLISRWKTGQRKLTATSRYVQKIAAYFLSQEGACQKLERTLLAYGLEEATGSLEENLIF
ncbi:helix-turn-helix domain-containing protein [Christensenellaceae bacterium OttesenSCG-928-K19]|nr:helix-turn-helix domain-containing protein [Christensenellaceae bacterium OttesenSCG-928-K19]